jgi:hypothetical protein
MLPLGSTSTFFVTMTVVNDVLLPSSNDGERFEGGVI